MLEDFVGGEVCTFHADLEVPLCTDAESYRLYP